MRRVGRPVVWRTCAALSAPCPAQPLGPVAAAAARHRRFVEVRPQEAGLPHLRLAVVPDRLDKSLVEVDPPPPVVDGHYHCEACQKSVPAARGGQATWRTHCESGVHVYMVRRLAMEAKGEDGCAPPPPTVQLTMNMVWCGICKLQINCMGKDWPRHVSGQTHKRNSFMQKKAGLVPFQPKTAPKAKKPGLLVG